MSEPYSTWAKAVLRHTSKQAPFVVLQAFKTVIKNRSLVGCLSNPNAVDGFWTHILAVSKYSREPEIAKSPIITGSYNGFNRTVVGYSNGSITFYIGFSINLVNDPLKGIVQYCMYTALHLYHHGDQETPSPPVEKSKTPSRHLGFVDNSLGEQRRMLKSALYAIISALQ